MARTKGSDDLYKLIHSLNKQEKGYFKKFAKRYSEGDSNFLKLFDAINAQQQFEEESLKKQFKAYARMKVYLFNMICDALALYYIEGRNLVIDMLRLYMRATVLEQKGLLSNAAKMYKHGADASKHSSYAMFSYFFNMEQLRLKGISSNVATYNASKAMMDNMLTILDKEKLNISFEREVKKLKEYLMEDIVGIDHKILAHDIDFALLHNRDARLSRVQRSLGDEALITYYCTTQAYDKAYEFAKVHLANVTARHKQWSQPNTYSRALMHYAMVCAYIDEYKDGHAKLELMRKIPNDNITVQHAIASRYVNYKLMLYSYSRDTANGVAFYNKAIDQYAVAFDGKKPGHYYNQIVSHVLYLLYYNGDYGKCIQYMNDLNLPYIQEHTPLTYRDIELLRLMLQIDFGNYALLGDVWRSVNAKLKKEDLVDPFIKQLLAFFKDVAKQGKLVKREAYMKEMQKLSDKANVHSFMGIKSYVDYIKEVKLK